MSILSGLTRITSSMILVRRWTTTTTTTRFTSTSAATSNVTIEDRGQIRLIGINRPHVRNAVNAATSRELKQAFEAFDADQNALVAVLHGHGGVFCAGYDLTELSATELNSDTDIEELRQHLSHGPMGPSHMLLNKPVVAAIDGFAVAGGLELALWADLRVVETTAIMGVFCRRFGVPLIDGGTVRLSKLIGHSRAMDMILTGRGVNGKEAFDFGLANRLVPVGTALGQAYNLARSLVKFPQECMLADRRAAYRATFSGESCEELLRQEYEHGLPIIAKEAVVGAKRFAQEGVGRHGRFVLDKVNNDVDVTV